MDILLKAKYPVIPSRQTILESEGKNQPKTNLCFLRCPEYHFQFPAK